MVLARRADRYADEDADTGVPNPPGNDANPGADFAASHRHGRGAHCHFSPADRDARVADSETHTKTDRHGDQHSFPRNGDPSINRNASAPNTDARGPRNGGFYSDACCLQRAAGVHLLLLLV